VTLALAVLQLISSLAMVNPQTGFGVGGRQSNTSLGLYRTTDGARTWTVVPGIHPLNAPTISRGVIFVPVRAGYERSDDGGRTWRRSALPNPGSGNASGVQMLDATHAYATLDLGAAAGSSGESLYRSVDGGRTWRFVSTTHTTSTPAGSLPFGCDKDGYGFSSLAQGWAGGYCAGGRPFLYRSGDGGRTWRYVGVPGVGRYCACDTSTPRFFDARHGAFAVVGFAGNGTAKPLTRTYWTSDGGAHWRASTVPFGRGGPVTFVDARTAWVPGTRRGVPNKTFDRLAVTTDAGRHWRIVRPGFDLGQYRLVPVSPTVAFAIDEETMSLVLRRTDDGGRTWRVVR
jgi:photosystem II stability/assembly factor-like uncharacterized protein